MVCNMNEECFHPDLPEGSRVRARKLMSSEFVITTGIELESLSSESAVVSMPLKGRRNSIETGHGGAIFTLADEAFALSSNLESDVWVALSCNISYHRPALGDRIKATSRKINSTRNHALYEVLIHDNDRHVATFQGLAVRLDPDKMK